MGSVDEFVAEDLVGRLFTSDSDLWDDSLLRLVAGRFFCFGQILELPQCMEGAKAVCGSCPIL